MKTLLVPSKVGLETTEAGFSLLEILVTTALLSIVGLGLALSTVTSFNTFNRSVRHALATDLVLDKLEQFAATNPSTLSAANDETNTAVTERGISFNRTTTVTVNVDGSRTAAVSVSCTNTFLQCSASFTNTFVPWGAT